MWYLGPEITEGRSLRRIVLFLLFVELHPIHKSAVEPRRKTIGPYDGFVDLHLRCKSAVAPLRKTIGPYDVGPVTYFVVDVRYGTLCFLLKLAACVDKIPHFMNDHVR